MYKFVVNNVYADGQAPFGAETSMNTMLTKSGSLIYAVVGVTKAPFANFSITRNFDLAEAYLGFF